MTTKHHLSDSPTGRFTAFYMAEAENITVYAPEARLWKYVMREDGGLAELREIIEAFRPIEVADIEWWMDRLETVEQSLDLCAYDIQKFGEVGVSG